MSLEDFLAGRPEGALRARKSPLLQMKRPDMVIEPLLPGRLVGALRA